MLNSLIIVFGKFLSLLLSRLNLGSGGTWPGHIALKINPNFIKDSIDPKTKIILVAGTNGKTTTSSLVAHILKKSDFSVAHNKSGANQLNGVASAIIQESETSGLKTDYLILETDENVLSPLLNHLAPDYIICLNLFRDQLDRYGEIATIVQKWKESFAKLPKNINLILNADDPQIAYLGKDLKNKCLYFGLNEKIQEEISHGADSIFCPNCSSPLNYDSVTFSHLGAWSCPRCGLKRPKLNISSFDVFPLPGTYNKYNTLAAVLLAKSENIKKEKIISSLKSFKPAFGRQEEFEINGKKTVVFLSKNPTSFNESLQTIKELGGKNVLFVLNDNYVDGIDVSWIWDINIEAILKDGSNVAVSGQRVYDMALRMKYANVFTHVEPNLTLAIKSMTESLEKNEKLYILPNYSAMLEVRKILTGRKIL